ASSSDGSYLSGQPSVYAVDGDRINIETFSMFYQTVENGVDESGVTYYTEKMVFPDVDEDGVADTGATVTVTPSSGDAKTYTTDSNGVLTVEFDFQTDFKVSVATGESSSSSIEVSADDLTREVMWSDGYWYYLDGGSVAYGFGVEGNTQQLVTGLANVVHLYNGKAITSSGQVYTLSAGNATAGETVTGVGTTADATATPLESYVYSNQALQVFENFSLFGANTVVAQRMYMMNGGFYPVSPEQNIVADGVLLNYEATASGSTRYFALLEDDNAGTMTSYITTPNMGGLSSTGVDHISTDKEGDAAYVLLLSYGNGGVAGVNYETGYVLFDHTVTSNSMAEYLMDTVSGYGDQLFGTGMAEDESYTNAISTMSLVNNINLNDTEGDEFSTDADGTATSLGDATPDDGVNSDSTTVADGDDASSVDDDDETDDEVDGTGSGDDDATTADEDTPFVDGAEESDSVVVGSVDGTEATTTEVEETTATGTVTGTEGTSAGEESTSESTETVDTTTLTTTSGGAITGDISYVEGEGVYVDGELLANYGELSYVEGEGVYVDGELRFVEMEATELTTEENSGMVDVEVVPLMTVEVWESQLLASMGAYQVSYNSESGSYEVVTTEAFLSQTSNNSSAGTGGGSDKDARLEAILEELEQEKDGTSVLNIGQSMGKNLTQTEESGFTLLVVAILASAGILAFIYFRLRKRDN
ncbi:MAG: hypothetical protein R3Y62_05790, partial [Eubacteriales bacterium]